MLNNIFNLINGTAILAVAAIIVKAIVYLNKSMLERLLFSDEQKIYFHFVRFTITSIVSSILFLSGMEVYSGDKVINYLNKPEELTLIISSALIIGSIVSYLLYYVFLVTINELRGKTVKHYFQHEEFGKVYIDKTTSNNRVILYGFDDSGEIFYVIEGRDKLLSHKIYREVKQESVIEVFKKFRALQKRKGSIQ